MNGHHGVVGAMGQYLIFLVYFECLVKVHDEMIKCGDEQY